MWAVACINVFEFIILFFFIFAFHVELRRNGAQSDIKCIWKNKTCDEKTFFSCGEKNVRNDSDSEKQRANGKENENKIIALSAYTWSNSDNGTVNFSAMHTGPSCWCTIYYSYAYLVFVCVLLVMHSLHFGGAQLLVVRGADRPYIHMATVLRFIDKCSCVKNINLSTRELRRCHANDTKTKLIQRSRRRTRNRRNKNENQTVFRACAACCRASCIDPIYG